jgi:hypothetical protein
MQNDNTWMGIHTKDTELASTAGINNFKEKVAGEGPECWNGCGGRHMIQDCKKPINQKRLSASKKKFFDAKNKKSGDHLFKERWTRSWGRWLRRTGKQ